MRDKVIVSLCVVASCVASIALSSAAAQLSANATVYASGHQTRRGLRSGRDGMLYVAEAGDRGTTSRIATIDLQRIQRPSRPKLTAALAPRRRAQGRFSESPFLRERLAAVCLFQRVNTRG